MAIINYSDKIALNINSGIADINKCKADDMNEIKKAFNIQVAQGWYNIGVTEILTLTYVSFNSTTKIGVIASNLDLTPYLSVGMKFKFTQNSAVKYGIIVAISSTQITLFMGQNYTLNNSGISNPFYSMLKAPLGFPLDKKIWSLIYTNTTNQTKASPTANTWYNIDNVQIVIPTGIWEVYYSLYQAGFSSTPGNVYNQTALSTSLTSISNNNLTSVIYGGNVQDYGMSQFKKDFINLTTQTTFYLIAQTIITGQGTIYWGGNREQTTIVATCAYI